MPRLLVFRAVLADATGARPAAPMEWYRHLEALLADFVGMFEHIPGVHQVKDQGDGAVCFIGCSCERCRRHRYCLIVAGTDVGTVVAAGAGATNSTASTLLPDLLGWDSVLSICVLYLLEPQFAVASHNLCGARPCRRLKDEDGEEQLNFLVGRFCRMALTLCSKVATANQRLFHTQRRTKLATTVHKRDGCACHTTTGAVSLFFAVGSRIVLPQLLSCMHHCRAIPTCDARTSS